MKILLIEGYARQSIPFARAFKKMNLEVTILCNSLLDCGYYSRFVDKRIVLTCTRDNKEDTEKNIIEVIENGFYDVIFPLGDLSAEILSRNKQYLEKYSFICVNDWNIFKNAYDKKWLMNFCAKNSIACPKTYDIESIEDIDDSIQYPLMVKPKNECGSRGCYKVDKRQELIEIIKKNKLNLKDCVIQEYIIEGSMNISENLYIAKTGEIKSQYTYACKRFFPLKGGTGTFNTSIDRRDVHDVACTLVKKLKLRGYIGIDMIIDKRDDRPKILEINMRPLACSRMGFELGINQARQFLQDFKNQYVQEGFKYKTGQNIRMTQIDLLWFLKSKDRFKIKPSFFSIKNTKDQLFYIDDPFPWFVFLINGIINLKSELRNRQT